MKINSLIFATGNKDKLREAGEILKIPLKGTSLEIEEVQSLDLVKVATLKAKEYYKLLKKPLFVEDGSLSFEALNGLPGTYINDVHKAIGNEGLVKLISGKNRKAEAKVAIVYIDKNAKGHTFIGKIEGSISNKPKGENGFGWDAIFIPKGGTKTFAEMTLQEKNKYSMRKKALLSFSEWLSSIS